MQNTHKPQDDINPEHFLPNDTNNTTNTTTTNTSTSAAPPNSSIAAAEDEIDTDPKANTDANPNADADVDADIVNCTVSNTTNPSSADTVPISSPTPPTVRTQNFSFASTYRPPVRIGAAAAAVVASSRFGSTSPLSIFRYKPIAAFTVLNTETELPPAFESSGKPNAIVRPIRRIEPPALARQTRNLNVASDTPSAAFQAHHQPRQLLQQHLQQARPLLHNPSNASMTQPHQPAAVRNDPDVEHFTEELNRKLRNLHYSTNAEAWTKSGHSSNDSLQDSIHKRPLFITTVPTGVFLPPAKEPPLPWYLKPRIYAYSTHPVVLQGGERPAKDKLHSSTAPIVASDKPHMTNASRNTVAAARALNATQSQSPPSTHYSLAGSVHLTKQQFQQQLQQRRAKRETPVEPYKNVMHERRVVRGTNYGSSLLENSDPFDKAAELRRRHALHRQKTCRNQRNILGTPPPVAGRRHEVIQTEKYLEELVQRPPEFSVDTQTDLFLEKPPTPPYIPAKVGVDAATEIGDGELFHFDAEAQPIIDILVDACIEQSMLEVAHEQEIAELRKKQAEFLALREAELAELRRLEAEELRLQAEKERRLHQDAIAKELDDEMQKSVTAAKLLQGHIAGLLPEVLDNLEPATDAAKKDHLMKTVCPWLTQEVAEEVGHIVDSREILTVIIQEIIKQRASVYAGYKEESPLEPVAEVGEGELEECAAAECCTCESGISEHSSSKTCPDKETH